MIQLNLFQPLCKSIKRPRMVYLEVCSFRIGTLIKNLVIIGPEERTVVQEQRLLWTGRGNAWPEIYRDIMQR